MDDPYAIEGTGAPETRLDIDTFSTDPQYKIRWDLFLRALAVVMNEPPENPNGFYRIAGIYAPVLCCIYHSQVGTDILRDPWLANRHLAGAQGRAREDNLLLAFEVRRTSSSILLKFDFVGYMD